MWAGCICTNNIVDSFFFKVKKSEVKNEGNDGVLGSNIQTRHQGEGISTYLVI